MTTREIGEKIRTMRESRGMTQKDLAVAIGLSESAVAMYEAGRRRPKDPVVEALADVFNVPKWSIKYHESEMVPSEIVNANSAPKTPEARIVSGGMDKLPKEQREQILGVVRAMFANNPGLFKEEG